VDDMLIIKDDVEYITFVKERLSEQFIMSDLPPMSYFLGIEVTVYNWWLLSLLALID
jgi:hypothetical protein